MPKIVLSVPNISCGHCVMSIKNEIGEIQGVSSVDGNPEEKTISVDFDAPAGEASIREKLKEIHYPAK
ncbi:COP-associated protein [Candidatus Desulfarcum epimagneticum]|uniref:COP-associated protein n=1 Tax=uncultured Desulfobacteraceae bacterium TaxID=218296 RepID=A0A484HLY2_9BACT|nr:COP-associated protein [uncultured Desulfobacteraceae bacterium]